MMRFSLVYFVLSLQHISFTMYVAVFPRSALQVLSFGIVAAEIIFLEDSETTLRTQAGHSECGGLFHVNWIGKKYLQEKLKLSDVSMSISPRSHHIMQCTAPNTDIYIYIIIILLLLIIYIIIYILLLLVLLLYIYMCVCVCAMQRYTHKSLIIYLYHYICKYVELYKVQCTHEKTCVYMYMYIYIYMCICVYICIYMWTIYTWTNMSYIHQWFAWICSPVSHQPFCWFRTGVASVTWPGEPSLNWRDDVSTGDGWSRYWVKTRMVPDGTLK